MGPESNGLRNLHVSQDKCGSVTCLLGTAERMENITTIRARGEDP